MSSEIVFTKDNLDQYLRELGKEYRRLNGKQMVAEIILIGGASVLINYGFRESTYDMDAIIQASSSMKDAINRVGDRLGLPYGWLNTDFKNTMSYTPKLVQYSKYYKTFANVIRVRTVTGEYLIAMKLMAGRQYKNDLSDIVGILLEQQQMGNPVTLDAIRRACTELYGSYEATPESARTMLEEALRVKDLKIFYERYRTIERENKDILVDFEGKYPGRLKSNNLEDVLRAARKKLEHE